MPPNLRFAAMPAAVFLLALLGLVHVCAWASNALAQRAERKQPSGATQSARSGPDVRYGTEGLPVPVLEMRDAILAAVQSGKIEELRTAVELNEIKPVIADTVVGDPIAHWRQVSADGEGREILTVLGQILDAGYVTLPIGRDLENNRVYVWPYFAGVQLDRLTPPQEAELLRIAPAAEVESMRKVGRYTYYKLGIAADGTWHFFLR
jgi:hypothetical protein